MNTFQNIILVIIIKNEYISEYTDALNEAEGQFSSILSDDVQSQLTKFQEQISEQKSSQNKSISENLAYIK